MPQLCPAAGNELRGDEHVPRQGTARRHARGSNARVFRGIERLMARMVPAVWEDRNGSRAEGIVYERLRDETPDDWFAVHSVGLTSHDRKPWAELDFVVVGPFGVLCLEVKGGRITVEEGHWFTNGAPLKESPFRQAGSGSAALYGDLDATVPAVRRAIVGHGVVLPDVR